MLVFTCDTAQGFRDKIWLWGKNNLNREDPESPGPQLWSGGEDQTLSWFKPGMLGRATNPDPGGETQMEPQTYNSGQPQDRKNSAHNFSGGWAQLGPQEQGAL